MRTLLLFGSAVLQAWGCSCMVGIDGRQPCQEAWKYDAVFTGTVQEITSPAFPPPAYSRRKVRFAISESLAGLESSRKEIVVETGLGGGDCGYGFEVGFDYIVYAGKNADGVLLATICSPTRPLRDAAADLKYFHQLPQMPRTGELRVTVFDARAESSTGAPGLAGATVKVYGSRGSFAGTTDSAGRHIFVAIPAGTYSATAFLAGYVVATPFQTIAPATLHEKGCAEIVAPLELDRVVHGQVLAHDGRPAAGVTIEAVRRRPRHENELPFAAQTAVTDAEGRYELRHLPAGEYYLGVSIDRRPSKENPYTRWFYPGTEDPSAAGLAHLAEKPESLRFDLVLPPPQRVRQLRGRVLLPDGRPVEGAMVYVDDLRYLWHGPNLAATADRDGSFTAEILDGTRYRVFGGHKSTFSELTPIAPGAGAVELTLLLTRQGTPPARDFYDTLEAWRKGLGLR